MINDEICVEITLYMYCLTYIFASITNLLLYPIREISKSDRTLVAKVLTSGTGHVVFTESLQLALYPLTIT